MKTKSVKPDPQAEIAATQVAYAKNRLEILDARLGPNKGAQQERSRLNCILHKHGVKP